MKATDLRTQIRIGNYVRDIDSGRIGFVESIGKRKLTVKMEFSTLTQDIDEFEPVELTEEWLLKMGFAHLKDDAFILEIKSQRLLQINNIESLIHVWLKDEFSTINKEYVFLSNIKYVHQLQNLYFSICGEELTIK